MLARGKLITKVENFIIALDPFLEYQVGPLYEWMRTLNGKLFGMAGRTLPRARLVAQLPGANLRSEHSGSQYLLGFQAQIRELLGTASSEWCCLLECCTQAQALQLFNT